MKHIMEVSPRARQYAVLRAAGAGHEQALLKAARGNWTTGPAPTVTERQLVEALAELLREGVIAADGTFVAPRRATAAEARAALKAARS